MRDGPVFEDYDKFRDFDVHHQTKQMLTKSISLAITALAIVMGVTYFFIESIAFLFYFEVVFGFLIMGPIIFYFGGRHHTKMNMAHQGYNIDWEPARQKLFGVDTYHILRADPGVMQASIIGRNANPFSTSKQTLQNIESQQRDGARCTICQDELFHGAGMGRDGGYFVEKRKRVWLFSLPIKEQILEWETFCAEHKPDMNRYGK